TNRPANSYCRLKGALQTRLRSMASAEDLEGLELCGQSESLTQRLRNILKDYSDGLAIPKEIIQNADDAGATKVTLIYDSRSNRQWQKSVLSGRMADCQGPSLWAHNNSEFTPEDFTNLLNLGGATKRSQSTKVGRFGLGFNSVYNLTDVPSVFSGWRLQFLDPHGETRGRGFLEDVYRRQGGNSTGVKLNFATKAGQQVLADFPHQFAPYAGVMGCASDLSAQPYRGTLIRLPLRTPQQAKESKICQQRWRCAICWAKTAEVAHLLLLFTQSVSALRLLHLRDGPKAAMLLEVKRSLIECLRPLPVTSDSGKLCDQTQVLTAAVHKMQQESAEKLIGQLRLRIETWYSVKVAKRLGIDALTVDTNRKDDWLQSTAIGFSDSLEMSQHNEVFRPPLASVAVRIKTSQDVSAADVVKPGVAFSFLPLPVETPLLFHVNATFAVTSSRRHLEETTMDESDGRWHPGRWNAALLREAACTALVAAIQRMASDGIVGTPDLWPLPEAASGSIWCHLVDSFYQTVFSADPEAPCVFPTNTGWKNLSKAVFLDELSLGSSALGSAAETVRRIAQSMVPESWGVAEGLAPGVQRSAVQLDLLGTRLWEGEYFVATFLRNLSRLWNFSDVDRKHCCELLHLLLRSLSQTAVSTEDPLRFLRCLSVQRLLNSCSFVPNQLGQLCPAKELLDPCCSAAALYDQNDSIFPRNDFQIADIRRALLKFGLKSQIDFDELLKRAESIYTLDNDLRKERVRSLMRCICESKQLMTPCDDRLAKLRLVEFLPALQKPKDCKLLWYSESNAQGKLFSPRALYDSSLEKLVSLCQPVFDKSLLQDVPQDYKEPLLRMIGVQKTVTWDVAWTQLCRAAEVFHEDSRLICLAVYQHLSKLIDEDPTVASKVRSAFKTCESPAILFSDHGFLNPQKVSLNLADKECQPYLFHLLTDIRRSLSNYRSFLKAVGVLEQFGAATYCQVLKEMQAKYNGSELTDADRKCSIDLLTRLSELSSEKIPERSEIFAPDNKGVLTQCSDLCFGSIKWLPNSKSLHFVHKDVAYGVCEKLRIPDKREQALKMHHTPLPFGQKEELTTRIKGILKSYPLGIEIFKELVQNADDAGATRIHLINDRRSFLQERVLGEEWKSLQGPALLVVNDTTFSDDDIEGIQNLGVGSKGSHPWKTGQYGIGFNCVYHVTDVPMFLSDNRVLCVMDPHCRYMPNATIESPGGMYKDESLKAIMTDFPHFFEVFELKFESLLGSTVFRLPLRTQDMARKSKICSNSGSVNSERISALFEELKSDLTDILLFLTNVRTITLSELAPDGKLTKVAEVTSEISGEDSAYSSLSKSARSATKVGVAARIDKSPDSGRQRHRAFNLLPLPLITSLPVHVNGHFALDPSRRNLWEAHSNDAASEWNDVLVTTALPECYVKLLDSLRKRIKAVTDDSQDLSLPLFYKLFPRANEADKSPWGNLTTKFYNEVLTKQWKLFPVMVRQQIEWLPLALSSDSVDGKAAFLQEGAPETL
uniref:HEPN domain-containing protein n=1 Tax=Macrostomum lignano TaxID=282301 RepID=A0A1I8J6Z7_9PLAT